jgi:hypothetical protein
MSEPSVDPTKDDQHDDDHSGSIWYAERDHKNNNTNNKTGCVILPEQKGNHIHLHTAVRKYTGVTLTVLLDEITRQRHHVIKTRWDCYVRSSTMFSATTTTTRRQQQQENRRLQPAAATMRAFD